MRRVAIAAALAAVPMLWVVGQSAGGHQAAPEAPASRVAPTMRYSQEKLNKIRESLAAQIAVRDNQERAMRAPTAEEAAALAVSASGTSAAVALPGGGVALRLDASQLSVAVADRTDEGAIRVTHGGSVAADHAVVATGAVVGVAKGGSHAR